jgi:hypothetical protein
MYISGDLIETQTIKNLKICNCIFASDNLKKMNYGFYFGLSTNIANLYNKYYWVLKIYRYL